MIVFIKFFKNKILYFFFGLVVAFLFLVQQSYAFDLKKLNVLPYDIPYQQDTSTDKQILIITDFGPLIILLDQQIASDYTEIFKNIIRSGYYENTSFYRMFYNYFIQAGDPNENGSGNADINFPKFPKKLSSKNSNFNDGTVALANTNENIATTGSQFFITFNDPYWLNNKYIIIGKVIYGLNTLRTFFDKYTTTEIGIIKTPVPIQIYVLSDFINNYPKFNNQLVPSDLTRKTWVDSTIETIHRNLINNLNTENYIDNININPLSLKRLAN